MNNLSNFVKKNAVGNQDFWLQMETSYGWENVALVIGYYDDYEACTELIAGLEATQFFNKRNYRCYPANQKQIKKHEPVLMHAPHSPMVHTSYQYQVVNSA